MFRIPANHHMVIIANYCNLEVDVEWGRTGDYARRSGNGGCGVGSFFYSGIGNWYEPTSHVGTAHGISRAVDEDKVRAFLPCLMGYGSCSVCGIGVPAQAQYCNRNSTSLCYNCQHWERFRAIGIGRVVGCWLLSSVEVPLSSFGLCPKLIFRLNSQQHRNYQLFSCVILKQSSNCLRT